MAPKHSLFRRLSSRLGRSNCYFFSRFLRFHPHWRQRGGLLQRSTREHLQVFGWNVGWHWAFHIKRRDGRCWTLHYEPIRHRKPWWRAAFHKIAFRGRIRRYDFPWGENRTR